MDKPVRAKYFILYYMKEMLKKSLPTRNYRIKTHTKSFIVKNTTFSKTGDSSQAYSIYKQFKPKPTTPLNPTNTNKTENVRTT